MKKYLGRDVQVDVCGKYRVGDIRHNVADLSHIHKKIGYKPKISFPEGLRYFTDWVSGQAHVVDKYEQSTNEISAKGLMGSLGKL
jgi:dTDP-L-rhamnose 4-epimerase